MAKPRIGITYGDPAGIGPEIAAAAMTAFGSSADFVVFGDEGAFEPGTPTAAGAKWAFEALEAAVAAGRAGKVDAIVTGPIHKASMYEAGFHWPGQTEFFAERYGVKDYAMLLTGKGLSVGLVTIHEPIVRVPELLSTEEIVRVGILMLDFLRRRFGRAPRLAVAGLNPHAGESGNIGREEIEIIEPAISLLRASAPDAIVEGPFPPDTIFHSAAQGEWDGVLCMYHDQGLIPLKLHAFHEGVNVTLGLPVPRTSPDHGTAFSLAGKKMARPDSMIAAIRLALELAASHR